MHNYVLTARRGAIAANDGRATARRDCYDRLRAPLTGRERDGDSGARGGPEVRLLRRGQSFGELALLTNYERTANVRALTYVEMCVLKREDVQAIFVKHPTDRRQVMNKLLMRTMENNEKNGVHCPMRSLVQEMLRQDSSLKHTDVSAMHAAILLTGAIDSELDDDSIKFGIGPSLRHRLQNLLVGRRRPQSSPADSSQDETTSEPVPPNTRVTGDKTALNAQRALERISALEETQATFLQLVHEMRDEVKALRQLASSTIDSRQRLESEEQAPLMGIPLERPTDKKSVEGTEWQVVPRRDSSAMQDTASVPNEKSLRGEKIASRLEPYVPSDTPSPSKAFHEQLTVKSSVRPLMRGRRASFRDTTETSRQPRLVSRKSTTF